MNFLTKYISFVAVFACIPAAFGATARPSVMSNAARRMPTLSTSVAGATTTTTTTTTNLLADSACIDAYSACIKGADACGTGFEECTNKVLFHAKMPQCLSTLANCGTSGITSLFGTSAVGSLATVSSKNSYGEITDYTYPTDGSVLGQMITAAAISNKYDTSNCVKRYTSCLKKDNVCGADFELCTTNSEFKKQMVFCDSTLARCQSEGLTQLFGSTTTTISPSATSRIGEMIAEGASLAAINAVSTCYKVVDQCILNACAENPYKCFENASSDVVAAATAVNTGADTASDTVAAADTISTSAISGYIKSACLDTIGGNKYCYATFLGNGAMPSASQLKDADNQEEVYDEAYSARMNTAMKSKISDLIEKFDTRAKQKCTETIKSCAMRVCGGGVGAACYSSVFSSADKSINGAATYNDIQTGCESVVNTDLNCKYAALNPNGVGTYSYAYIQSNAFTTLFPEYDDSKSDPIGVVAALNAALSNAYSDAAIAQMKKQCQSVATSCVKSMCGTDYVNCYRNRTDMYSKLTDTGNASFDKSMNKVGGVLDYTVVLGLCLDTVKNASSCEEHLAIEQQKLKMKNKAADSGSWGESGNVRSGWIDAGSATSVSASKEKVDAYDENGNQLCTSKTGDQGTCDTVDENGNVFDTPVKVSYTTYLQSQAASTLFRDLIYDIEKEAQAKYNAKLTKEQNMCLSSNNGGLVGNKDTGSTYMWVKLKSSKVPKNYAVNGLKTNQFVASNDLYGSFCRIRVTLQSDDKQIQEAIRNGGDWGTAYFAVGDSFTCGSWIPSSALETLADAVADKAVDGMAEQQKKTRAWVTAASVLAGTVGGGVGGYYLGKSFTDGKLAGLNSKAKGTQLTSEQMAKNCGEYVDAAKEQIEIANNESGNASERKTAANNAKSYAETAVDYADKLGVLDAYTKAVTDAFTTNGDKSITIGANAAASLDTLKSKCDAAKDGSQIKSKDRSWITPTTTAITAVVGGAATGGIAWAATKSVQDKKLSEAEQAAYDEWMNAVGKHITCYIGGDEAGAYGDIITTSID